MTSALFVSRHRNRLFPLFLLVATLIAYHPAWHGGFTWDDNCVPHDPGDLGYYSLHGLGLLWVDPPHKQYYPLAFSLCWLEYHLWGFNTLGFHLVNILLHALDSILLWKVLRRLDVPGAWLAAAIFALHPVNVETAAWISETRNTLSGLFYLCSILAALKFWLPELADRSLTVAAQPGGEQSRASEQVANPQSAIRNPYYYWLAFALFVCGLLSKTTIIPLPAVILLLVWWKRGKIVWRDTYPLFLFVAVGVAMGLITRHYEQGLSANGKEVQFSLVDRCLLAGRNLWFYSGKLTWPHPLIFIYPRWKIDPSSLLDWLPLLALAPVALVLWLIRNRSWGRPVFVALAYYVGLLFFVLGFFNISFFLYSFVADHFQYLACMGPIALFAAGITLAFNRLGKAKPVLMLLLSACLLTVLGVLTWNQSRLYASEETLLNAVVSQNPNAFVAYDNLGGILWSRGKREEAIQQYKMSVAIHPDPRNLHDLGIALLQTDKPDEAVADFQEAIKLSANPAPAYADLGTAYVQMGQIATGIKYIQKALQMMPDLAIGYYDLGNAYFQEKQLDLAIANWQKTLDLLPGLPSAHNNLANAFLLEGQPAKAIQHWKEALAASPDLVNAQVSLAWVLATCPQASLRNGNEAMELAQRASRLTGDKDPVVLRALAAAYAESGRFPEAVQTAQHALQLAQAQSNSALANSIQSQMQFYQTGLPFHSY